jgi:hypothetical protein
LRKVLQAIALPLFKQVCLYRDYYHKKKNETKMPGNKAMTMVARHLLRKIFRKTKGKSPVNPARR